MICQECVTGFFVDPIKVVIFSLSLVLAITCLITLKTRKDLTIKKQIALIYSHLFFLVFPIVFYLLFRSCQKLYANCSQLDKILILIGLTAGVSLLIGSLIAPLVYLRRVHKKKISLANTLLDAFLNDESQKIGIQQPTLTVIDEAKPFAFSDRRQAIYISVGLLDLLSKKEQQAVLLHELYHLKERTPWYRFSVGMLRVLSPLAHFTSFDRQLNIAEQAADAYATKTQKTIKHLSSAKRKMNEFFSQN